MRELKFRAWDTKTKKMIFTGFHVMGEVTAFGLIDQYIDDNRCGADTSLDRWNDIELMQYTGLTDCNGKEIYEGDIVLVPIGYPEDGKPIYGNFQGVIVYGSPIYFTTDEYGLPIGTTGFFIETKDGRHSMLLGRDEKVIGNIYENKELLESE